MEKLYLQPTNDNIRNTFINNSINRNNELVSFIRIIDSINENYSIALDSYWGSGKTFFVKQMKMILDSNCPKSYVSVEGKEAINNCWNTISKGMSLKSHIVIYYDAWKNDNDDDPIYSLIYQIIQDTNIKANLKEGITFDDILNVAGKITNSITGIDPYNIASSLMKIDFLDKIRERHDIDSSIEDFFKKVLPDGCDRLLIIIDELDRCNPNFAVKLLERIKHYFNNEKITFIFAVNLYELQVTIKNYYGNEFNASRYLDRFFDLRISLPQLNIDDYLKFILKNDDEFAVPEILKFVIRYFNMQMRECCKFISVIKLLSSMKSLFIGSMVDNPISNTKYVIKNILLPIIVGARICDISLYNKCLFEGDDALIVEFYNKIDITDIPNKSILLSAKSDDSSIIKKLFIANLQILFSLLNKNTIEERTIGKCMVSMRECIAFREAVSLLSDKIVFNDTDV